MLIQEALRQGKRVVVPYCIPGTRQMEFYYIRSMEEDLEPGAFGVWEPKTSQCEKLTDDKNSICIVPGLSFDYDGFRLGYGKGYYDRFLCKYLGVTVGICYTSCIKQQLPHGYYDVPVKLLITEKYLRRIHHSESRFGKR